IQKLSISAEIQIIPKKTLIIFDEIQEAPPALTSLKYFQEKKNEYHIIATGSLLGIKLKEDFSFPVGKVNIMHLYPLSFIEFLNGIERNMLVELLKTKNDFIKLEKNFHNELIEYLKIYFYIGGMPEAINMYIKYKDLNKVREVQKEILQGYEADFAKHTSKANALRISNLWNSIPAQLAKESKKFVYSIVDKNTRHRDLFEALHWLLESGLIHKNILIKRPSFPLKAYIEENMFKVFLLDIGLLGALVNLSAKVIIEGSSLFSIFNGAFTENFAAQELIANQKGDLYYWKSKNIAEIDFLLEKDDEIIPLEVKAGINKKAKSLKVYNDKYKPKTIYRLSLSNFSQNNNFFDLPLYAVILL
ncbi:ATP-binding protein, partial [Candidatus Margulisiibacteriota bacterium]